LSKEGKSEGFYRKNETLNWDKRYFYVILRIGKEGF